MHGQKGPQRLRLCAPTAQKIFHLAILHGMYNIQGRKLRLSLSDSGPYTLEQERRNNAETNGSWHSGKLTLPVFLLSAQAVLLKEYFFFSQSTTEEEVQIFPQHCAWQLCLVLMTCVLRRSIAHRKDLSTALCFIVYIIRRSRSSTLSSPSLQELWKSAMLSQDFTSQGGQGIILCILGFVTNLKYSGL